jgi:hypothetical protein
VRFDYRVSERQVARVYETGLAVGSLAKEGARNKMRLVLTRS